MKKPITLVSPFTSYTTSKILGEGGAGRVFLASEDGQTPVAIKVLNPARATSETVKRFKNEVRFGMRNAHPNIVTILDNGLYEDAEGMRAPFYVMPVYSSSLRKVLAAGLPPTEAMWVFLQILDGVEAAHFQGIIHRDLKLENILYDVTEKRPVVADFGIAHFEQEDLYTAVETKDGTRLANFQYAAPEQKRRGATVDHRADIYALGLILNELFTAEVPAGTGFQTIEGVAPEYAYLDLIVAQMIRQNPVDRPQNIEEIKREIQVRGNEIVTYQSPMKFNDSSSLTPLVESRVGDDASGLEATINAAVGLLKQFIVDDRHRIQLTELFAKETEKLYQRLGLESFPTRDTTSNIGDRIKAYDRESDMLTALLITGCHWGTEQQHRLWVRSIERIAHPQETDGGLVSLLDLRRYPAFRLAFAACISAVAAGRYDTLYAILAGAMVANQFENERRPLSVAIYYQNVVQRSEDLYPMFNGERRYAPLADHLFNSLRPLFADLIPRDDEYEALYDKTEYLWGLFHQALKEESHIWVPMGRLVYKWRTSSTRGGVKRLSDEISASGKEWPLLKSGFLSGSFDSLKQTKQAVDTFMSEVSQRHW